MDKSKSKISSKLFYLAPLSNKNGHDTDKIDDEKFEFVPCVIIFMDFQYITFKVFLSSNLLYPGHFLVAKAPLEQVNMKVKVKPKKF